MFLPMSEHLRCQEKDREEESKEEEEEARGREKGSLWLQLAAIVHQSHFPTSRHLWRLHNIRHNYSTGQADDRTG